jgi:hypothetical protein
METKGVADDSDDDNDFLESPGTHVCVFNQCACGRIYMGETINDLDGGGGGGGPKKKARQGQMLMAKLDTKERSQLETGLDTRRAEQVELLGDVKDIVGDMNAEVDSLRKYLRTTSEGMAALNKLEAQINTGVNEQLKKEKFKLDRKKEVMNKLKAELKKARKNQMKILCGIALWKTLCVLLFLVLIGGIVSSVFLGSSSSPRRRLRGAVRGAEGGARVVILSGGAAASIRDVGGMGGGGAEAEAEAGAGAGAGVGVGVDRVAKLDINRVRGARAGQERGAEGRNP